jgi:CopA family copper-resistance protein
MLIQRNLLGADNVSRSRRRFVRGAALAGGLAFLGAKPKRAWAQSPTQQVLSGTEFDLSIAATPVNYTGRTRLATTVNGTIPAPILRWREGTDVTLRVKNLLSVPSSIHWHGILVPFQMDGVPGVSFDGIAPGATFVYRFPVKQSGTYWYHSHSTFQEQTGHYGPLIIDPAGPDLVKSDRDYVVMLSDWTDENPDRLFEKLKVMSDYYNYQLPTAGDFFRDVSQMGLGAAFARRREWDRMRMNPTDFVDVTSATYTYLVNGTTPAANWTAIVRAGETVRLRFINGSASSIFDVRIPGLRMTVVSADGQWVDPVTIDEFRLSTAETYDVLVKMEDDRPYTIFAQSLDRMGYARATLAPRAGLEAPMPPLDPRTWLTMKDMGMGDMESMDGNVKTGMKGMEGSSTGGMKDTEGMQGMQGMQGHDLSGMKDMPGMQGNDMGGMKDMPAVQGQDMSGMKGMQEGSKDTKDMSDMKGTGRPSTSMKMDTGPSIDNRAMSPYPAVTDPGPRLRGNGRGVLTYSDLHTTGGPIDARPPSRDIELHLTGNMSRFIWGFDGKKFSEAQPVKLKFGERLRIILVNDTMMTHPIHLHGMWSEVEGEDGKFLVRKHTVNVHPGSRLSYFVTADAPGQWAYHCHLLYHMEAGMFRKMVVT